MDIIDPWYNYDTFQSILKEINNLIVGGRIDDSAIEMLKGKLKELNLASESIAIDYKKMRMARGRDAALLSIYGQQLTATAKDLIINPNPVDIPCTHKGKPVTYRVAVNDILVIKSKGRVKEIHLKKKAIAVKGEGGLGTNMIQTNNVKLNFDNLMYLIQAKGSHLRQVNQSCVINVYQYVLLGTNRFTLNEPAKVLEEKLINEELIEITADAHFNREEYIEWLLEMDRYTHHLKDYEINTKKIEEIDRYKESQGMT